jgi:hypothetical protein
MKGVKMIKEDNDKGRPYTISEASKLLGWDKDHKTRLKYYVDRGIIPSLIIGETPYVLEQTIKDIRNGVSFPTIKNDEK